MVWASGHELAALSETASVRVRVRSRGLQSEKVSGTVYLSVMEREALLAWVWQPALASRALVSSESAVLALGSVLAS